MPLGKVGRSVDCIVLHVGVCLPPREGDIKCKLSSMIRPINSIFVSEKSKPSNNHSESLMVINTIKHDRL